MRESGPRARESSFAYAGRRYDEPWWSKRLLAARHRRVAPGRRNRRIQSEYDAYPYRARHLIETFASLKSARRIATRYDQALIAHAAFGSLAGVFH
jgi:hypothetical protein